MIPGRLAPLFVIVLALSACQMSTPKPAAADLGAEFTLAPGQTATLNGTDLTITFESVTGDQRCPIGVECYATGPVSLQISVQTGAAAPAEFFLQTFTGSDGRAPSGSFEGIQSQVEVDGYLIRVVAVLPHPEGMGGKVRAGKYRVSFVVLKK